MSPRPAAPTAHLDEVARLLAEAILRAQHRQILKRNPTYGTPENQLELYAGPRTHVRQDGERT